MALRPRHIFLAPGTHGWNMLTVVVTVATATGEAVGVCCDLKLGEKSTSQGAGATYVGEVK